MRLAMVASGSKGNLCIIESNTTRIIIDCGISLKRLDAFLSETSTKASFDAILITHEHTDHISGLRNIAKKYKCPVYMTYGTKEGIIRRDAKYNSDTLGGINVIEISHDEKFSVGDISVCAIPTSHDVIDPVGFIINSDGKKAVYITDTGYIPDSMFERISNADMYVMETNHDPELLMHCEKRPYPTRIRILGDKGHLSNEDGLDILAHVIGDATKHVFYAHISEDCNLWNLIDRASKKIFKSYEMDVSKINFIYTSQKATEYVEV